MLEMVIINLDLWLSFDYIKDPLRRSPTFLDDFNTRANRGYAHTPVYYSKQYKIDISHGIISAEIIVAVLILHEDSCD